MENLKNAFCAFLSLSLSLYFIRCDNFIQHSVSDGDDDDYDDAEEEGKWRR
jgi:hypothetical protein